jgi:RNA polymerase primary sigma factor
MKALNTLPYTHATPAEPNIGDGVWPLSKVDASNEAAKAQVYQQWRRGMSVAVLSRQYGLSASKIKQILNNMRAKRILDQAFEYVHDPSFETPVAATFLGPMPEQPRMSPKSRVPAEVPPYLANLYAGAPLLSREQETHLFRKMNYLKFRASNLRQTVDPAHASEPLLDEIERLQEEALDVKNQLIGANVRLVVSIVKTRVGPNKNFFEMVSDGNMSLIRAVERFDFSRGFKFSTYATWAIVNNFNRTMPVDKRWRDRFVTGFEELLDSAASHRPDEDEYESDHRHTEQSVQAMLDRLDDRERRILVSRYGIGGANELTLTQLGKELGITKERVRQIQSRAENKLRKFAQSTLSL